MPVWVSGILLVLSLAIILFGAEFFTNSVEWLGRRLRLGEAAVGSLLAAVGTAMPETMIPIIAILFTPGTSSHEVGIGAIAGAPFMLGTLAFFVTGVAVIAFSRAKRRPPTMQVNARALRMDMLFFLVFYGVAISMTWVHVAWVRNLVALGLMAGYVVYSRAILSERSAGSGSLEDLYVARLFGSRPRFRYIGAQLVVSLAAIIGGANLFVSNTVAVAAALGASPMVLAMIIAPIATELPEKFNSVIWIGKGKDTLAMGNISGAMVFQSSFPVALGVALTPWELTGPTLLSAGLAMASVGVNYLYLRRTNTLSVAGLLLGGLLYLVLIAYLFV
ncbi:MAG: sodium:calcium antiporter [Firmicutes bacterium]|nr:sodium:calcium antiporter [Bacillota bacterium]